MIRRGDAKILQIGEVVTTIPTIGFNVESVTYKNLNFNVWVCLLFPRPPFSLLPSNTRHRISAAKPPSVLTGAAIMPTPPR